MKKVFIFLIISFGIFQISISNSNTENFNFERKILSFLDKKTNDKYEKVKLLGEINKVSKNYNNETLNKTLINLNKILELQIKNDENEVKEIIIGITKTGKEIKAYYRGNPNNNFLLFIANIHGGYEYETYETAKLLKEKLISGNKKGWMIVETLNPDGLEYYFDNGDKEKFYLEGRANANGIDLNRNFCTESFSNFDYTREKINLQTGEFCASELEVQAIENLLKNYNFSGLIDIHSAGGTIFIPENSFDDGNVINFANNVKNLMGEDYFFETDYRTQKQKYELIELFEVDSGGEGEFTGTLITYFYEQTGFPAVLIELSEHGKVEEKVLNLVDIVK